METVINIVGPDDNRLIKEVTLKLLAKANAPCSLSLVLNITIIQLRHQLIQSPSIFLYI